MKRRVLLGALFALVTLVQTASAQIARPFTPRFSANDRGDILLVGNTLMSCSGNGNSCNRARNGTGNATNNNDWNMQYVDIDGDGSTFNSSSASLTIPPGASVVWAGLYWGGSSTSGTRSVMRFSTPAAGYATVTASQLDVRGSAYQGFADVTARIQAGGSGTYTGADVRSTTGSNRFAGWSLVVVYRNPADPPRNLVVFDGYAEVAPGAAVTIPVSGFVTPPGGAVNTRLGVVTYEGDEGYTGDSFSLNGTLLANGANPSTNFFNSSISDLGAHVTAKNPNYENQLGFDVDRIAANGVLPNGASSATIRLSSTDDRYYPGVVSFATDLYSPVLSGNNFTKFVADLNGGAVTPGDELEYTIHVRNTGNDGSAQTVVRDTIPAYTTYVAGSMQVLAGPNAGAKSDGTGDDQAEFDAGGNRVVIRVGTGANAATGGGLAPGQATSVRFRVRTNSPVPAGAVVSNQAVVDFNAAQLGTALSAASDADTLVAGAQRTNVTVTGTSVAGHAYADLDHDLQREAGEDGTGAPLWAKLVPVSSPGTAQAAASVDPVSGVFAFGIVAQGTYTLILDTNATLGDVTPTYPSGFLGTEAAGGIRPGVVVATNPIANEDFGLWFGSRVEGRVHRDDGAGGGTANDGLAQGSEAGSAGVRVRLTHASCAGGVCDSTITDGGGAFAVWTPGAVAGAPVSIAQVNPGGWISTGGRAGTTAGTYDRGADAITFTAGNGVVYTGSAFGDVPDQQFAPAGNRSGLPGTVVLHPHTLTAGSAGTLTFTRTQTPAPPIPGWSADVYHDLNCDGAIGPGEVIVAPGISVVAGQTVCVILRHVIPLAAPAGASETVRVEAAMDYTGAAPALGGAVGLDDVTSTSGAGQLEIVKAVDRATALPGDVLTYTITYRNSGGAPLSAIEISDATPAYTVFESASCGALGGGLAGCGISAQPASGATGTVTWSLAGVLAPGESGTVTFQVRVE
jgi:uncharacterized repeat protein (TIGR01451 family)